MPFAVIETINAEAEKELSVVPDKLLRCSKNGNIVLWPNTTSTTEKQSYFRDENVCPQKSWLKYKCTVKRYPISTYESAIIALEAISDRTEETSLDSNRLGKRQHNDQEPNRAPKKVVVENSGDNQSGIAFNRKTHVKPPPHNKVEMKPLAPTEEEGDSFPVIISAYSEANSENIAFVLKDATKGVPEPTHQLGADHSIQKCLDKMNEILGLQHLITARLDQLEEKVADLSTQNQSILNAIKNCCKRSSNIEETLSFVFQPMENAQQLEDLEKKLEDEEFKSKLLRWLRLNVSGDCTEDRMLGVLDALFTKKFQTLCSWTGISRKGPKTAVLPNRNILEIFQIIGSGDSDEVNQRELANFFMKKLKNSQKRLLVAGLRRAARKVRRKKKQKQEDPCNNSDDSSSRCEAETESYSGYIEDSGSSDVEVLPTAENSYNAFSIVKIE